MAVYASLSFISVYKIFFEIIGAIKSILEFMP